MKLLCVMILSIVSATNLLAEEATKQLDEYFKKTIVGNWKIQLNVNGIEINSVDTYLPNGKVDQKWNMKTPNGVIN